MLPKVNSLSFWLASNRSARFFYVLLSGLCFWLAFPPYDQVYLLFVAFVPLLLIEDDLFYSDSATRSRKIWLWSSAAFLVFNTLATWWVKNAALIGAVAGIIANTLLMTTAFYLFHTIKKRSGERMALMGLVSLWMGMEFLNLNWDLDFPWLILGNAFANTPWLVQWYSITGVFGGSLWVLVINILLFQGFKHLLLRKKQTDADERKYYGLKAFKAIFRALVLLLIPALSSLYTYQTYEQQGVAAEVVVVQPNYDPYGAKFNPDLYQNQLDTLLFLSDRGMSPNTKLVFWPETSVPDYIWLRGEKTRNWQVDQIQSFLSNYEGVGLVAGASALQIYPENSIAPDEVRTMSNGERYVSHNSALFMQNFQPMQIYHKSKLVIGVEKMPYPKVMGFLNFLSQDLGGMTGSLGKQKERAVFELGGVKAAPVICYESIFGGFTTGYVREKGANLLAVVTNDGWWGDTDGYRQHMAFARLRAIENRRDVVRSANTGISCFINQRGDVVSQTDWWVQTALSGTVHLNEKLSFYTKYGDYLGRSAAFLGILLYLVAFSKSRSAKKLKPS
jgi:apolipoprotein N-acyltransferase